MILLFNFAKKKKKKMSSSVRLFLSLSLRMERHMEQSYRVSEK